MLILRILSVLALALACVLFAIAGIRYCNMDPAMAARDIPDAMAGLTGDPTAHRSGSPVSSASSVPPLVGQAHALAAYLNGAAKTAPRPAAEVQPTTVEVLPLPTPPPARLMLHATSYYPDQPQRSMALVSERNPDREPRWVREGSRIGPFTIQEIRRGAVLYRQGEMWREATVDPTDAPQSIVRGPSDDATRRRVGAEPQDSPAESPASTTKPQAEPEGRSSAAGPEAEVHRPVSFRSLGYRFLEFISDLPTFVSD